MCNKAIILDFDGTIFRLFCNYDKSVIFEELNNLLKGYEIKFGKNNDVFDVFNSIVESNIDSETKRKLLKGADEILERAECEALSSGILTKGFQEFLEWAKEKKFLLAIVTNNSEKCVKDFFIRNFARVEYEVVGRDGQRPDLMKPDPFMLYRISEKIGASKDMMCFIGDNPRDYECAMEFGCKFIGLTPTIKKRERLEAKTKNCIIVNNFVELVDKETFF